MTVETQNRKLTMKYAGGMVKHLGLQMYSGLVGAVAELIANAWDADSEKVAIEVPFDKDWDDIKTEITVTDFGQGMTFEECNEAYLMVGRDRRQADERDRTLVKSRRVMGRKGIGKLACFGVAKVMEVRTVKDNWLTHFRMDYTRIVNQRAGEFVTAYEPDVLFDMPVEEASGTRIILKQLQIARRQTEEQFRQSMARRFSVLSDDFLISINDIPLRRDETPFQFRYPEQGGWNEEIVGGVGRIRWWAGFTQATIKDDEARGFVVLARGKMAQTPFFFDLSGGAFGQHGMQYLTGEVEADGLDVERDVIATDRASVRWDDPLASPLLEWGQQKVRRLLTEWAESRTKERIDLTPVWRTPKLSVRLSVRSEQWDTGSTATSSSVRCWRWLRKASGASPRSNANWTSRQA